MKINAALPCGVATDRLPRPCRSQPRLNRVLAGSSSRLT